MHLVWTYRAQRARSRPAALAHSKVGPRAGGSDSGETRGGPKPAGRLEGQD